MSDCVVLVVDDEQKICDALERVFELEEIPCLCLVSAGEALRRLREGLRPRVIISDYRMPEMNGNDFLSRSSGEVPLAKRIMLTGQADFAAVEKAINEVGLYRFMQKPWNDQDLLMTVKGAVAQSDAEERNQHLHEKVQEQLTELRALDRLKDEFVANVSHELRTPINCLQLVFSNLEDGVAGSYDALPEKLREYLGKAQRQTENLKAIIDDLLDMFKLDSDACELHTEVGDVSAAVSEEVSDMSLSVAKKGLGLRVTVAAGVVARFDAQRIRQVVRNLMSNAVKFTDAGEIGVSLSEEDGRVVCSVRDSGVGIRDQDREAVFDRFRQVGEKAAGKPKGTGLGLAICKRIVVLHGGSIRVEGGVDRGSTFVFDFPKGV